MRKAYPRRSNIVKSKRLKFHTFAKPGNRHQTGSKGQCSLGKGEVVGSIPPRSTILSQYFQGLSFRPLPCPPPLKCEQIAKSPSKLGEFWGKLFPWRSNVPRPARVDA